MQVTDTDNSILTLATCDLVNVLSDSLSYRAIMQLESTCTAFRSAITPSWLPWLRSLGYADELEIPARGSTVARRVVVLESERRASFPHRLRSALVRLGLHAIQPAEDAIGHLATHPADQGTLLEWEDSLRLLQYRHGFLLDRRCARALRALPFGPPPGDAFFEEHFRFRADTLPGASDGPSEEAAARRVASGTHRELSYPQRAAWLPADAPCLLTHQRGGGATRVGAATPRRRQTVAQVMKELRLDAESKPTLEELLEGRDLELCAFSPLSEDDVWEGVFTPEVATRWPHRSLGPGEPRPQSRAPDPSPTQVSTDMPHRFFDGPKLLLEDAPHRLLSYPKEARFSWQVHERGGGPQRYHRMALYTTARPTADDTSGSEPTGQPRMRTCTPAERLVCAHLAEHGLQPRQMGHGGKKTAGPPCTGAAPPSLQPGRVGVEPRAAGAGPSIYAPSTPTSMLEEEEEGEALLLASQVAGMGLVRNREASHESS